MIRAGRAHSFFAPFSTSIHVIIFQSRAIIAEIERGIAPLGIESNMLRRRTMKLKLGDRLKHLKTEANAPGWA
jgi:hypothetical protein